MPLNVGCATEGGIMAETETTHILLDLSDVEILDQYLEIESHLALILVICSKFEAARPNSTEENVWKPQVCK